MLHQWASASCLEGAYYDRWSSFKNISTAASLALVRLADIRSQEDEKKT